MSRGLTFQPDGFYHLYNRGTEKREIFTLTDDYERFISLLYLANSIEPLSLRNERRGSTSVKSLLGSARGDSLVDLCAYCLMPNHFHLLVHERIENGISRFMQKLATGYTMYFNTRCERTGALFQGKFKAQDANDDRYLKYLISYIHVNPISLIEPKWKELGLQDTDRAMRFLESYQYSSYPDYSGVDRIERRLITQTALPEYFESTRDFKETMTEWLNYKNDQNI